MSIQKNADMVFGLLEEMKTKTILEERFNLKLFKTEDKYALYDFYDANRLYKFELKNYRYSYHKYKYQIIGVNKGISNNSIFIFRHECDNEQIYYIRFNRTLFDTFNKRFITYRGENVKVYDIPKQHLRHLENNKYNSL
jgi:hypothetical protein